MAAERSRLVGRAVAEAVVEKVAVAGVVVVTAEAVAEVVVGGIAVV